jgi:outer membrane protein assembly factor BamB
MDNAIRGFDADSGKEIWKYDLPAGGQATPMTYTVNGKQYLVIAAGGHGKLGTKQGDYVLAFTLPSVFLQMIQHILLKNGKGQSARPAAAPLAQAH